MFTFIVILSWRQTLFLSICYKIHTLRAHFAFSNPVFRILPCPCCFYKSHNPPFYNQHSPYSLFSFSVVSQPQRERREGEGEGERVSEWVSERERERARGIERMFLTYEIPSTNRVTHIMYRVLVHLPTAFRWRVSRPPVLVDYFLIDKFLYFFTVCWAASSWLINIRDTIWAFHVAWINTFVYLTGCVFMQVPFSGIELFYPHDSCSQMTASFSLF